MYIYDHTAVENGRRGSIPHEYGGAEGQGGVNDSVYLNVVELGLRVEQRPRGGRYHSVRRKINYRPVCVRGIQQVPHRGDLGGRERCDARLKHLATVKAVADRE